MSWRRSRLTYPSCLRKPAAAALLVALPILLDAVPHAERRQRQHLRRPQEHRQRRRPRQDYRRRSTLLAVRRRLHREQGRDFQTDDEVISVILIQSSPLTVTPSGHGKSVTVTRGSLVPNQSFGTCQKCNCMRGVTVNSVTVSGEICSRDRSVIAHSRQWESELQALCLGGTYITAA